MQVFSFCKYRDSLSFWRNEHGGSLLEFTLVVPFMFALGLGVFEFGNLFFQYHMIDAGVRDASRYLGSMDRTVAVATTNARRIAVCGNVSTCSAESDKRVSWWPADIGDMNTVVKIKYCIDGTASGDAIDDCACATHASLEAGTFAAAKVCVSADIDYEQLGFLDYLGLGPITITAKHEQRYFGIR